VNEGSEQLAQGAVSMNIGNRVVILLVTTGLMGIVVPTSGAEAKSFQIGVLAEDLDLNGRDVPPATSLHAMTLSALSSKKAEKMDALLLDQADAAAIRSDAALQERLRAFILSGKPAFLVGGALTLSDVIGVASFGADVAYIDGHRIGGDESLLGLMVHPDGSFDTFAYAFASPGDLKAKGAGKAADLALGLEARGHGPRKGSFSTMTHGGYHPYWSIRATASYCLAKDPYGELCYAANFNRLEYDSSGTYDWWTVQMTTTTAPGKVAYGNAWRTHKTWSTSDVDYYRTANKLIDFGAGSAYNLQTLSYDVGTTAGVDGALETVRLSASYNLLGIASTQASWKEYNDFYIRHDFDLGVLNAEDVYSSKSAYTIRVCQGCSLKIPFSNKAEFRDYLSGNYGQIYINSWREIYP